MIMFLTFILTFFIVSTSWGNAGKFDINSIVIKCEVEEQCDGLDDVFKSLRRSYESPKHFHEVIKFYVSAEGFERFYYRIDDRGSKRVLYLEVKRKPLVTSVKCRFIDGENIELPLVLPIKVDDFLDKEKVEMTKRLLLEISETKGFPLARVNVRSSMGEEGVQLNFDIRLGQPIVTDSIRIIGESALLRKIVAGKILQFEKLPFDLQRIKGELESVRQVFLQYGYYLAELNVRYRFINEKSVEVFVNLRNEKQYTFYVQGNSFFSVKEIKKYLSSSLISSKREMVEASVDQSLRQLYQERGFFNAQINVRVENRVDQNYENSIYYFIDINERSQSEISTISLRGNSYLSRNDILNLYYQEGTELIDYGIYDKEYFESFVEILREKYISLGFVSVSIEKPIVQKDGDKVQVLIRLREGTRAYVDKVKFNGVPEELKNELSKVILTKQKEVFNPLAFKADLELITKFLNESGYYYAEIKNLNSKSLVQYSDDNSEVDIQIDFNLGSKMYINEVVIVGNRKTRSILIRRETRFEKGSLLKRSEIINAQTTLLGLGLFSSVQIRPVSEDTANTDLLIFVREKDFGTIELAPGIRSDLGLKLSGLISYNNFDGMNKKIAFRGSVNKRFDLHSLHEERQKDANALLEYDTDLSFSENHIFHSDYDFEAVISKARKRLYSFDADIQQTSYTVSRDFKKWFNVSIKQQLETISQFDAVDEQNHGHFQIGSITPSVTFDFRDNRINPSAGSFFNLSVEFANPTFLSQSNDELVIDYYKLVNRNRFYFPISTKGVLAISTAFGIQENKAGSDGYIPSIKVFRLSGPDIVRGFEDSEINRLISGNDISEVEVNERAYMANIKIEPRFYISDSAMLGVFYDAGRVYVNEFDNQKLRSSVGLTFKYLTPVGSLDFDYGIKLLRKRDSDGIFESPGRLHVSIGFF